MIRAFGARKVREAEAPLLAAGVPLMERASGALALAVLRLLGGSYGRRALALVGRGNNGGDALFAAAFLARRGMGVAAVVAEGAHGAGLAAARAAGCAVLDVADIDAGFPSPDLVSIERADLPLLWPVPGPSSHKYTRGVVGVVAGSTSYPGAGLLCVDAALAAGPGMVRYAGTLGSAVVSSCPEAVLGEGRVDAWVIGPGLDREALARAEPVLDGLRSEGWTKPAVLDAGALAWAEPGMTPAAVLTPHAGELAALFSRLGIEGSREGIAACPAAAARLASEATGATVALKGPVDVVVSPGSPVYAQPGPAWRAVAGAGDVYAGFLGALLAAGLEPARAAAAAACVHGLASENGPMRASDIVRNVPAVVRAALAGGGSEEGSGFYAPGASASAFHMRRARVSGGRRPMQKIDECARTAREES